LNTLSRREFFNVCTKENLTQVFKAIRSMKEGEKETGRRSCEEAGKMFFKNRLNKSK